MRLLSQLKKDMDFNLSLYKLVEVLKEISIFQYHILEKKLKSFEKIFDVLKDLFAMINIEGTNHPFINTGDRTPGIIAITSDAGLLGGLNRQVMVLALKEAVETNARLIIVGERGRPYAAETNVPYVSFEGIKDDLKLYQALALRDYIINEELKLNMGKVKVIYPYAISMRAQHVQTLQLLPYSSKSVESMSSNNAPLDPRLRREASIIMESSIEDIAGYLVYLLLGHKLYEIFGLSRLAELAARFVHLEDSKTKIERLNKQLKFQYFRLRHEIIDRNMRELFAARLAFRES